MILLCPIQNGIHNVFFTHGHFACDIIAAGRTVGCITIFIDAIKIPGAGLLQWSLQIIGVIVNHIHNHSKSHMMEILNHLLALSHTYLSMVSVCGKGALRYVVVHGIIAPVKLLFLSCLVHGSKIIHGHNLDGIYPKFFYMGQTIQRMLVIYFLSQCRKGSPKLIRVSRSFIPGKIFYV